MTSSSVPTLHSNVNQFGSSNRCNQHVRMRSHKILILPLYFIIMSFNATAFDNQIYTENTPKMNETLAEDWHCYQDFNPRQYQYHEPQSKSNTNSENTTLDSWTNYLAKCSSSVNDFVGDIVYYLQHMPSSFPLSALEIFCLIGVCLSFTAVMVIISLIERLIERVTALETENAELRENVKMNRLIVTDIVSDKKSKIIPEMKDLHFNGIYSELRNIAYRQRNRSDETLPFGESEV